MKQRISLKEFASEIRRIYNSDPAKAPLLIEGYAAQRLKEYTPAERTAVLEELSLEFRSPADTEALHQQAIEPEELARLFSMLLGREITVPDLSSGELFERLSVSLNTIFDTLNEIVKVINMTLLGRKEQLETIRQIIGSHLEHDEGGSISIQAYLDQIKAAFLVAHKSFKLAVENRLQEILTELDPERIASATEGGLRFGPLRKAELYEIYVQRFENVKRFFLSGQLTDEFVKEFEKHCEKQYRMQTGETG
jgi:hypothetical protein